MSEGVHDIVTKDGDKLLVWPDGWNHVFERPALVPGRDDSRVRYAAANDGRIVEANGKTLRLSLVLGVDHWSTPLGVDDQLTGDPAFSANGELLALPQQGRVTIHDSWGR